MMDQRELILATGLKHQALANLTGKSLDLVKKWAIYGSDMQDTERKVLIKVIKAHKRIMNEAL